MASSVAGSPHKSETRHGIAELAAELEELSPWAQNLVLSHSPGLQHMLSTSPGLQHLLAGSSVSSRSWQPPLGDSLGTSQRLSKRDEAKHSMPWMPSGSVHMRSTASLAESSITEKDAWRSVPRRGFCISKTPRLNQRAPMSARTSRDSQKHQRSSKVLYWNDCMGSFIDGGAAGPDDENVAAATCILDSGLADTLQRSTKALAKRPVLPPNWDVLGYKLVAKCGERYFSLWAGESAEYELGVEMHDEALPDRRGGLYICDSPESAARQHMATNFHGDALCIAMLRCACRGPFIDYGGGKAACSSLTPLSEVVIPTDCNAACPKSGVWARLHATGVHGGPYAARAYDSCGRMMTMPGWEVIGYTVCARLGQPPLRERLFSLWAMEAFRYDIGVPVFDDFLTSPCRDHLSVVSSAAEATQFGICVAEKLQFSGVHTAPRVLVRCACDGPFVELPDGRVACSKLTALEEISMPRAQPGDPRSNWQAPAELVPSLPTHPRQVRLSPKSAAMRAAQAMKPSAPKRPRSAPHQGRRLITQGREVKYGAW